MQTVKVIRGSFPAARYLVDNEIINEQIELPQKILQQKAELAAAQDKADAWTQRLREEDALLAAVIQLEVNDAGKPLYSNAEQRSSALIQRKRTLPSYLEIVQRSAESNRQVTIEKDKLTYLEDRFSLIKKLLTLAASELQLIASGQYLEYEDTTHNTSLRAPQAY
jgi:hypothetical protein